MNFEFSPKVKDLQARLLAFMDQHVYPNEHRFEAEVAANRAKGNAWVPTQVIEELKVKARAAGLWNLFLPHSPRAPEGMSLSARVCGSSTCQPASHLSEGMAPQAGVPSSLISQPWPRRPTETELSQTSGRSARKRGVTRSAAPASERSMAVCRSTKAICPPNGM